MILETQNTLNTGYWLEVPLRHTSRSHPVVSILLRQQRWWARNCCIYALYPDAASLTDALWCTKHALLLIQMEAYSQCVFVNILEMMKQFEMIKWHFADFSGFLRKDTLTFFSSTLNPAPFCFNREFPQVTFQWAMKNALNTQIWLRLAPAVHDNWM